jgi:hypothetical protein
MADRRMPKGRDEPTDYWIPNLPGDAEPWAAGSAIVDAVVRRAASDDYFGAARTGGEQRHGGLSSNDAGGKDSARSRDRRHAATTAG